MPALTDPRHDIDFRFQSENHLRKQLLIEQHGTLDQQKRDLIDDIVLAFSDPERWPVTDEARIKLLKSLYKSAQRIQELQSLG